MTSALRILVISDASPFVMEGGAERVLWEEASRLVKAGHEVRIVSRSLANGTVETVERQGVRIRHFPSDPRSPLRFVVSSILQARRVAAQALAESDADVLNLHQPLSGYGVLRSPAGQRIPSLYTFLSPGPLEYRSRRGMTIHHRSGWVGWLGMALLWIIEGACLKRATRIRVLSDFSADLLWKLYRVPADRIVKIPGGVDTERFLPAMDRDLVRQSLGLKPGQPLLFTVRNLEARMGLDSLIRAMAILRQQAPEALLLIGGAGSLRDDLESLTVSLALGANVRFLGYVPDEQLPLYYQAADLFVLPTRELEGFGLVTVEALACGTPVLGTRVGATPELLHPLDPALLFRDTTPETMAEDISRALEAQMRHPVAGQGLRQACRNYTTTHFSWSDSVARLADTLGELVEGRGGSPEPAQVCPSCGDSALAEDLCYRGTRYLRCARCQTGTVAAFPTAKSLREHYETDYTLRYRHGSAVPRADLFVSMLDHLGELCRPGRLLDLGCGTGHLLEAASQRGWRALGTDLSYHACAIASETHGFRFVQAESAQMPFRNACMHAVTSVNVLDQVPDPIGTLREAYRVLAPGGYLMIRIPNAAFHRPWVRLLTRLGPMVRWYGVDGYPTLHLYTFTPGGLRRLVERAGLRVLEVRNSPLVGGQTSWAQVGLRAVAIGRFRKLVAAGSAGVKLVSGGRWLVGPSIELYAKRP